MPTWNDTTSYRQGERGNILPESLTATAGSIRCTIHHYIGCGDQWYCSCQALCISVANLDTADVEVAKGRALKLIDTKVRALLADVECLT